MYIMAKFIELSDKKDAILKDYYQTTMSKSAIAKKHLISTDKLRNFLRACGIYPNSDIHRRTFLSSEIPQVIRDYSTLGMSCAKIAAKYNCSDECVRELLVRKGVPRVSGRKAVCADILKDNKEWIINAYKNEKLSGWKIAETLNVSGQAVYNWLKALGVDLNLKANYDILSNKESIIKIYRTTKLTYAEIGEIFDCWGSTVRDYLIKWGVPLRKHYKTKDTSIETYIAKLLDEQAIKYIKQFQIESRYYDFYIPCSNLIIEVNGDYWHGNPKVFPKQSLNTIQKLGKLRDRIKKKLAIQYEYQIIYIWELDIKKHPQKVLNKILQYARSKNK